MIATSCAFIYVSDYDDDKYGLKTLTNCLVLPSCMA